LKLDDRNRTIGTEPMKSSISKNFITRRRGPFGMSAMLGMRCSGRGVCLAVLVAGTMLLGACSQVKLGYSYADTLIMLWGNTYVDLDTEQEALIRPRLQRLLEWHRATQLPDYARLMSRIEGRIDPAAQGNTPVNAAEILAINGDVQAGIKTIIERALPDLADLALSLRTAQIDQIDEKMGDSIRKFERDVLIGTDEHRARRRADRSIERAEEWFGRFSNAQRAQFRALAAQHLHPHTTFVEERQRRRRELIGMLKRIQRERPPREAVIESLRTYADGLMTYGPAGATEAAEAGEAGERRARQRSVAAGSAALTAAIINGSTPAQRARAAQKVRSYVNDFAELAGKALANAEQPNLARSTRSATD